MIYTVEEVKTIIPTLSEKTDPQITSLLEQAEGEILYILKKKTLPVVDPLATPLVYPTGIKTACRMLIEGYLSLEKRNGIAEFRQGSISVKYDDSEKQESDRIKEVKKVLAPFFSVQIWS